MGSVMPSGANWHHGSAVRFAAGLSDEALDARLAELAELAELARAITGTTGWTTNERAGARREFGILHAERVRRGEARALRFTLELAPMGHGSYRARILDGDKVLGEAEEYPACTAVECAAWHAWQNRDPAGEASS